MLRGVMVFFGALNLNIAIFGAINLNIAIFGATLFRDRLITLF